MKRVLVVAALVLCAQVVSAQPPCWPNVRVPPVISPSDKPVQVGQIAASVSSAGMVWGYACLPGDGTLMHVIAGGTWSSWSPDWLAIAMQALSATDEQRAALWRKYVTSSGVDDTLRSNWDAVKARLPKPVTPPPAGTWIVAPTYICAADDKDASGRCVRRQSFAWDGTTRGLVAQPERATIGSACITSIGKEPYFGFDAQRPDRVVLCVKQ